MSRYFKQKKEHVLLKDLFLPLASFVLIVALFSFGIQSVSQTAREEQLRFAEQAVRRAAVQCYAVEGRYPASVEYLKKFAPDIIIVAAFGQILPKSILDLPKYGCINVHASLLPKYRGAAPIQWAVINGDEITGVTIMRMDVGLDTGDIIAKKQVRIAEDETGGSLFDKLAAVGAELCVETMQMLENKTATFTPQDNEASTHTKMISKELGDIDWKKPAVEIERLIRGLNPWPSAYTHLDNKAFKIWKARVVETDGAYAPGCICKVGKNTMVVQTGEGGLELLEVQLAGKKRMDAGSFLRGYPVAEGSFLQQ